MRKLTVFMTGLVLLFAMAAFARQSGHASAKASRPKSETTHQASGTISSVGTDTLVLTHKVNGKQEQTTFTMNSETRKQGDLRSGEKAMVHYRVEGGQNIATAVTVKAGSMSAASNRPAHKR